MINDTIFEIPVYPCTQDEADRRIARKVDKDMREVPDFGTGFWEEQRADEIRRRGGGIRYNEIIGFVEIHVLGSQLRADYWISQKKRIVVGAKTKPKIAWQGKLLEKHFPVLNGLGSEQVYSEFRASLERCIQQSDRLRRRFVDFSALDRIAPFVDWAAMVKA